MKMLALLRGINVGGNNIIKKDELKACFEAAGCEAVLTYIQSGNILFKSNEKDRSKIAQKVQTKLKEKLGNPIQIVIFNEEEYKEILHNSPKNWGEDDSQKHNALFLLEEMTPKETEAHFPQINPEFESANFAPGVVFWSGSKDNYTKSSYVKKLVKSPLYKKVTIRNANTSFKLLELFEKL